MEEQTGTETVDCLATYGPRFTHCKTESGPDCCFVGDAVHTKNEEPVDCFKTYGADFEDCERDWGWDCCIVDDILNKKLKDKTDTTRTENLEPMDCYKTLGPKFVDCQTEMGWDCCYEGDAMDKEEESITYLGPSTCAESLGPKFTDCGVGYGIDCCYVDDGTFMHNHTEDTYDPKNDHLKHFAPFYESHEGPTCVEQLGTNFTECGRGHGLDCCYIDDGVFLHSHGNMDHFHDNGPDEVGALRWLVLMAVVGFCAIQRAQRKSRKTLSSISSNRSKTTIPHDDDKLDGDADDIELKPLI